MVGDFALGEAMLIRKPVPHSDESLGGQARNLCDTISLRSYRHVDENEVALLELAHDLYQVRQVL